MPKVLVVTYYWPPAGGAGVQRWLKFCKYLPEYGYEPIVLTVDPDFASYPVKDESFEAEVSGQLSIVRTKSTEPLQWFSKLFGSKKVPYSGFSNVETDTFFSKASRWVRGNVFIPDARKYWVNHALPEAKRLIAEHNITSIITTGPPHSTHLIGVKVKEQLGLNWIADFRDPWTDIYYYNQLMHTAWAKRRDLKYEDLVLRNADRIISVCPSNFDLLSKKDSVNTDKMIMLTNGYDTEDFADISREGIPGKFVIAYTGTIATTYNVRQIFESLAVLEIDWQLRIAGMVPPEIKLLFSELGISERVELLGYVPHKDALQVICSADALLHIVPDIAGTRMGTTGKLFEYIGSGVPIINFGPAEGDSAKFIAEANAGKSFERTNKKGVIAYIQFLQESSEEELEVRSEVFSRKYITGQLKELLDSKC